MPASPRRIITKSLSIANGAAAALVIIVAGCLRSEIGAVHGFYAPIEIATTTAIHAKHPYNSGCPKLCTQTSQTTIRHQRIRESQSQLSLAAASTIVEGVGEEGCNLPAPSGINTKNDATQALVVGAIVLSLGAGTILFSSGLHALESYGTENNFEPQYEFFRTTWCPVSFGAVHSLLGVTHFAWSHEYENIVPTRGAWGVWNPPGSKAFHVAWTGAAELAGGLGLLVGGLSSMSMPMPMPLLFATTNELLAPFTFTSAGLVSDSAAALFVLTLAVTPANIFMYTHGAKLPMESEPLPLSFHVARWVMQVVILGFMYQIGGETFSILFDRTTN